MPFGMAGHHDDRQEEVGTIVSGAHLAHEFEPVHRLHHPVDDDDIDGVGAQLVQAGAAVTGLAHGYHADRVQHGSHEHAHVLAVVDNQNTKLGKIVTH